MVKKSIERIEIESSVLRDSEEWDECDKIWMKEKRDSEREREM